MVTTNDETVDTGLQKNDLLPKQTVGMTTGANAEAAMPDASPDPIAYRAPTAGVAEKTVTLGKTVDSADDMARLMIVTHYAGSRTVKVYAIGTGNMVTGTKSGYIEVDDNVQDTDDANNTRLRSAGSYYLATALSGDQAMVAEDAESQRVYYYVTGEDAAAVRNHVVLTTESTVTMDGTTITTYTYSPVAIRVAALNHDADEDTDDIAPEVTAKIPEATAYEHIHFGVWAALGEAEKDGSQEIDGSGHRLRPELLGRGPDRRQHAEQRRVPSYTGNWVAAVQADG